MPFANFDPLKIANSHSLDEAAIVRRQKRNIHSILHSYVGWYDPFAELIQNALDSVDKRSRQIEQSYIKRVRVIVDIRSNQLTVSDNGTGLDETTFHRFLAPNESFKDGDARGSKGVGATYIAYGFNHLRIDTKTKTFLASGIMEGARNWLHDDAAPESPQVVASASPFVDSEFSNFETGVSITIKFDSKTKPSTLAWPNLRDARSWYIALSIKTALGAVKIDPAVDFTVVCIDRDGKQTVHTSERIGFTHPQAHLEKVKDYDFVISKLQENFEKKGAGAGLPPSLSNLEAIELNWDHIKINSRLTKLQEHQRNFIADHRCSVSAVYIYTAEIWKRLASKIGYKNTANLYAPGIQLAADNMPQGETIQVPLTRYTGRQNQVFFLIHFENCIVDLGRKGFDKDFVDIAKEISTYIVQDIFSKVRDCLKIDDLRKTSLLEKQKVNGWKQDLIEHEASNPLFLRNENFFNPINEIAITAQPSREQDVIALFNQLIAGGVIRGIRIVGTNEQMTYDGAVRISVGPDYEKHEFNAEKNPLGISSSYRNDYEENHPSGFLSNDIMILEYKYSVNGLINDIGTGDKKTSEINLIVSWEMGEEYEKLFSVHSLLTPDGRIDRDYHGITHKFFDEHGNHCFDAVILKDLISYLNSPNDEEVEQLHRYG
ncbi:hypothetical protein L905_25210 [Agrobacterium sp. TS43]|uniref:ATP-binding protein n=1 Tax=Agrobacterium TaxID=357 RepID=UPI0004A163DA|nr:MULTISPECIES: ATP-binding protein [Agrobacterium]KDR88218.1 hypothetical protein K538_23180 [Agrobacterium tumefaciens GW4]KVK43833.1 hypothetical protein L904_07950 [Agrobacterium sp. LY4]KVK44536.1 hypothetical protein L903_09650 [Agrobacterium sp. JL28]KVK56733.1 hypothetical protein L905_25210 [Agrobacterium sp. TS43]KVK58097.1 hypothetical protein L906_07920 [Agrobacterium sp. TS45]